MSTQPWKSHPNARKCAYCGSIKPGAQPLRLNGKRAYWHIQCFEAERKLATLTTNLTPSRRNGERITKS